MKLIFSLSAPLVAAFLVFPGMILNLGSWSKLRNFFSASFPPAPSYSLQCYDCTGASWSGREPDCRYVIRDCHKNAEYW